MLWRYDKRSVRNYYNVSTWHLDEISTRTFDKTSTRCYDKATTRRIKRSLPDYETRYLSDAITRCLPDPQDDMPARWYYKGFIRLYDKVSIHYDKVYQTLRQVVYEVLWQGVYHTLRKVSTRLFDKVSTRRYDKVSITGTMTRCLTDAVKGDCKTLQQGIYQML